MKYRELLPAWFRSRFGRQWEIATKVKSRLVGRIKWWYARPLLPCVEHVGVNLHLGCGKVNHPSFINIDLIPYPHIHYLRSIDDLSNFSDHSVDLIYASHCLEHFSFRKVPSVLREWNRVLKHGAILRLSVPDFDSIVTTYHASSCQLDMVQGAIVGGQDCEYNFHYVVFNRQYLTNILRQVGFNDVREWKPGLNDMTTFDDWSGKVFKVSDQVFPISLNLEARKST